MVSWLIFKWPILAALQRRLVYRKVRDKLLQGTVYISIPLPGKQHWKLHVQNIHTNACGLDNFKHKDDEDERIWEMPTSLWLLVGQHTRGYGGTSPCPFPCPCQSSPQQHPAQASDADIYKPWMTLSGEVLHVSANKQQCFKFCSLGPR